MSSSDGVVMSETVHRVEQVRNSNKQKLHPGNASCHGHHVGDASFSGVVIVRRRVG